MKKYYPVHLLLEGRNVLIIGGGQVAERKLRGLLGLGAKLVIISPTITQTIMEWVKEKQVEWIESHFQNQDVTDFFLIISATNDSKVTQEIQGLMKANQLVNFGEDHESSTFIIPAIVRRGGLQISISTSGASPKLTKKIKKELEGCFESDYEGYIDFLYQARMQVLKRISDPEHKQVILEHLVSNTVFQTKEREQAFVTLMNKYVGVGPKE